MARHAFFEIARTDSGFTARFIAANGVPVWTTSSQVYPRRAGAVRAINSFVREFGRFVAGDAVLGGLGPGLRIVDVDERTAS